MRASKLLLLAGLLATLAALPAASQAATVSTDEFCDAGVDTPCDVTALYSAAPGEVNTVSESLLPDGKVRFEDPTATLVAGAGCVLDTAHQATCDQPRSFTGSEITLGDQADTYTMNGALSAFVRAGDGDDVLNGGSKADSFQGDGGADTLHGNDGDDQLDGDASATPASDVIDGGPGSDMVEYFIRNVPVTVDLNAPGGAGQAGENDKLQSIENAQGGNGADTLTGDGQANELFGSGGADVIDGRGGNDTITGGKTQKGGAGDDRLDGLDKGGSLSCGDGADTVGRDVPERTVPVDCETVIAETGFGGANDVLTSRGPLKALKGNRFIFRFRCTKETKATCPGGKAKVIVAGKTVGSATVPKITAGKRAEVAIALPSKVAKKIRGKGQTATFSYKPKGGRSAGYTTLMRLV